ncbi:hypothetical protein BT63DRAFT_422316 [Microthyrium microscopicum]|uniref:CCHC-type domain-containing protein n=1 Tax=Microthyrium microscopicum TaxID=703497 RepID=A0A6A6UJU9_9PEZI|nr:hypothetical protein BT63DRAFT_422316 [Microthyrium microscopicum]
MAPIALDGSHRICCLPLHSMKIHARGPISACSAVFLVSGHEIASFSMAPITFHGAHCTRWLPSHSMGVRARCSISAIFAIFCWQKLQFSHFGCLVMNFDPPSWLPSHSMAAVECDGSFHRCLQSLDWLTFLRGCKGKGHLSEDCPDPRTRALILEGKCFVCESTEHKTGKCPHKRGSGRGRGSGPAGSNAMFGM